MRKRGIRYKSVCKGITPANLKGFFVGWPKKPSPAALLKILKKSSYVFLAVDAKSKNIIGLISPVSDKTLSAYIPLLEVLPEYRGKGIGKELIRRMLGRLKKYYMIDLLCDPGLRKFYESAGMKPSLGMRVRNYKRQAGC